MEHLIKARRAPYKVSTAFMFVKVELMELARAARGLISNREVFQHAALLEESNHRPVRLAWRSTGRVPDRKLSVTSLNNDQNWEEPVEKHHWQDECIAD